MQRALQKKLIGPQAHRQLLTYLGTHLPHFKTPTSATIWLKKAPTLRAEIKKMRAQLEKQKEK